MITGRQYLLIWSPIARKHLQQLPKPTAIRITKKVEWYLNQTEPLHFAKRLVQSPVGVYRFRVGDYRIIFDLQDDELVILVVVLTVRHRKDIYE